MILKRLGADKRARAMQMQEYQRAIRGRQMPGLDLKPNELYYPAFKVVCMGDTNGG